MDKQKEPDFTSTIERYSAMIERVKALGDKAAKAGAFTLEESATMFSDLFSLKELVRALQPAPSAAESLEDLSDIAEALALDLSAEPVPCKD